MNHAFSVRESTHYTARQVLRLRKAAKTNLGLKLFSDPVWSLMLALYSIEHAPRGCCIGSAAERAGLPRSTALRSLLRLANAGFVSIVPDPKDKRAARVNLTAHGMESMERSFLTAQYLTR